MKSLCLRRGLFALSGVVLVALLGTPTHASSHREAPAIALQPKIDGTDFYMFRSYETGREGYVTFVACYQPLQDPYGGPNYFKMDPNALYEIHVDNNGDAVEDLTFQFRFQNTRKNIALQIGNEGDKRTVAIPLTNAGAIAAGDSANLNVDERYTMSLVRGDRRTGTSQPVTFQNGQTQFTKPSDYIGKKSIPDYDTYAGQYMYEIAIPGCTEPGRVFVGQRRDPFIFNIGETFDLFNLNPLGEATGKPNLLAQKNITAFCLEVPISCLVAGDETVIGAWTTSSARQVRLLNPAPNKAGGGKGPTVEGGAFVQQSRLGHPLVNEVVVGLKDKDRFNASEPKDDTQFGQYVTHPTLPALLELLFGVRAPTQFPRTDMVQVFLTGIPDLNQPANVVASEMLRLNTAIAPTARAEQNPLGVLGGDLAGFPNGRRPVDDVIDSAVRVVMGVLLTEADAPDGQLPYVDGLRVEATAFLNAFPYVNSPVAGSEVGKDG